MGGETSQQRRKYKALGIREPQAVQCFLSREFEARDEMRGRDGIQLTARFIYLIQRAVKDLKPGR